MSESERPAVFVHLLPTLVAPGALDGGVAVVVDVLRATTVMVHALAAGFEAIIPCDGIEKAKAVAASLPPGAVLLAGERQGLPIPGFDLGNSPDDFHRPDARGKTLVMTTTNGTRAILASLGAEQVALAAMVNSIGAIRWAGSWDRPVHVVCAGTDGRVSLEDTMLAGEIVSRLSTFWRYAHGNDEAYIADALFSDAVGTCRDQRIPWPELVARGRGGRRLREIGLQGDIETASERFGPYAELVPVLQRDPVRITCWAGPDCSVES
jgi:2-phosphosulfolactate phosphatase